MLVFISQLKIEKNFSAVINIDEEKDIHLIVDSADIYFIRKNNSFNFILNNKVYIVDNFLIVPMSNNKFSIKINDYKLQTILQPNTTLKININVGFENLYKLLL
ncbi:MAG: hypothetical protein KFW07_03600 [Mycoplasmataceae bacterium]|nr:hypothetical protein [Mycoplasmataceae bacterium]